MNNDVIARLAAANPVPRGAPPPHPEPLVVPTRRIVLALALMAAVALPAVAFADKLGDLLGLSNQGTPVATRSLDLSTDTGLNDAMKQLAFPSKMHLLGNENGVRFYAARRADGDYCFAIESTVAKGVGCDLDGTFPSPARPVMVFPPLIQFAGFARRRGSDRHRNRRRREYRRLGTREPKPVRLNNSWTVFVGRCGRGAGRIRQRARDGASPRPVTSLKPHFLRDSRLPSNPFCRLMAVVSSPHKRLGMRSGS
jgi:hypothetical protein